jgi:aspartyl-tRNA(Asn)/glutamyl-tRNA(Gln) amidotransferase subunit B
MPTAYEVVIGLEAHVQLLTESKLFCACPNRFTLDPNVHVCPVCLGHPGVLPVLNRKALELGMKAALALHCEIPPLTKFDRKHYYYPDLPKNYQISQYDLPLSVNGWLDVPADGAEKRIRIKRAHLEEDAGKLLHGEGESSVDLNRTGTPLLEIVTEPDLRSPAEAKAFLELLKLTLLYTEVSDCDMEKGNLRCDANISIRPLGESKLGTKNEIKNMNSFKGVEAALQKVADDLIRAKEAGEPIRQVTWGYSIERDRIFQMRTKEEANDYRYFPEPDLPPVKVSREWVEEVRNTIPELPQAKQKRFEEKFHLPASDAKVLVQDLPLANFYAGTVTLNPAFTPDFMTAAANVAINNIPPELSARSMGTADLPTALKPEAFAELIQIYVNREINAPTMKLVLGKLLDRRGGSPREIVEKEGLAQVSDQGPIREALEAAVRENPGQAAEVETGKHATANWFIGQVMKAMKGKADPGVVSSLVAEHFHLPPEALQKKKK